MTDTNNRAIPAFLEQLNQHTNGRRKLPHGFSGPYNLLATGICLDPDGKRVPIPEDDDELLTKYLTAGMSKYYNETTLMSSPAMMTEFITKLEEKAGATEGLTDVYHGAVMAYVSKDITAPW